MDGLFKEAQEVVFEDLRVVYRQERGRTEAGHPQTLNRYTFSLIDAANPPQPTPTSVPAPETTQPPVPPSALDSARPS